MALPEWLLTFLLSTCSVGDQSGKGVHRFQVPPEGVCGGVGGDHRILPEDVRRGGSEGLHLAQAVITEFFAPVSRSPSLPLRTIPAPVAQKALMFKDMAEAAEEIKAQGVDIPSFPQPDIQAGP